LTRSTEVARTETTIGIETGIVSTTETESQDTIVTGVETARRIASTTGPGRAIANTSHPKRTKARRNTEIEDEVKSY
jgi:hypothetical protein